MFMMDVVQKMGSAFAAVAGHDSPLVGFLLPAYESLLYRGSNDHAIRWSINGVPFRINPFYRRQLGKNYDPSVASFLRDRVRPGAVCLDVGANVGAYVLQLANWVGPHGRVIAFEPNPDAMKILAQHVKLNCFVNSVTLVPFAVGASNGEALLFAAEADGQSRLGVPNAALADRVHPIKVSMVTLDTFCEIHDVKPDWIVIDIEGFEIAALIGASKMLTKTDKRPGLIVEMHPSVWDSAGTTREEAESLFRNLELMPVPLTGQLDALGEHGLVFLEAKLTRNNRS
jgi:FkbM family methyltransferase